MTYNKFSYYKLNRFFQKHESTEDRYPYVNSIGSCDYWLSFEGRVLPLIQQNDQSDIEKQ